MTLGGIIFCYNAIKHDYCIEEAILSLKGVCDEVLVLDAGSTDGTQQLLEKHADTNTVIVCLDEKEWHKHQGREKISYFQNLGKSMLTTDYYFLLQSDEVISEVSYDGIRDAIKTGQEAFYLHRVNLWGNCNFYINVPENKQPCSTKIIRLAKIKYNSIDDGESIEAPATMEFFTDILIIHYGFVRKKEVMKSKIIHMQEDVFQLGHHDPKLDGSDVFDSTLWFSGSELSEFEIEHPPFMKEWIKTRP